MRLHLIRVMVLTAAATSSLVPNGSRCARRRTADDRRCRRGCGGATGPVHHHASTLHRCANGVQVTDRLPAALRIPPGMARVSRAPGLRRGDRCVVNRLADLGARATLVIPAIVAATTQPPCSVNVARFRWEDSDATNDRAVAGREGERDQSVCRPPRSCPVAGKCPRMRLLV